MRIDWTDLDEPLRQMRAQGLPGLECAARLGVSRTSVERRLKTLGLNTKLNKGRIAGPEAINLSDEEIRERIRKRDADRYQRNREKILIARRARYARNR